MSGSARAVSLPPPVGGWDALSPLVDMPTNRAQTLINWFPDADKVTVRRGYTAHATGMTSAVETLFTYQPPSGTNKMFAAADLSIFDVTAAGAVGAAVATGTVNNRFQWAQMTTAGGHFILAVNGATTARLYDGATWANSTITGPTLTNLVWVNMHQRRLWFGETNTLRAWYLAPNAVTGAAASFDFTGLASLGGSLMAMGTWTRDGGSGPDDLAVFLTTEGEVLIYTGTDPSSAATWALVGIFRVGRPLGRRCMVKAGADLIIMTDEGFVELSRVLPVDRSQQSAASLTTNINPALSAQARQFAASFGWQPMLYPTANMLIFNVPAEAGGFEQYVFNTITRAACRFTGIPARCFGLLGDAAYFGGLGTVFRFDSGTSDNGAAIVAFAVQAPNAFGAKAQKKNFRRARPILQSEGAPVVGVDLALDYATQTPPPAPTASVTTVALWDVALWDVALWAGEAIFGAMRGVRGVARVASVRLYSVSSAARPSWIGTDVLFTPAGSL
jgi:hypothetical protein